MASNCGGNGNNGIPGYGSDCADAHEPYSCTIRELHYHQLHGVSDDDQIIRYSLANPTGFRPLYPIAYAITQSLVVEVKRSSVELKSPEPIGDI